MADKNPLPDIGEDDIQLLAVICRNASALPGPPFKALCTQYQVEFRSRGLSTSHDPNVFRWIIHIGDAARKLGALEGPTNLFAIFKDMMDALGVTLVDNEDGKPLKEALELPSQAYLDELETRAISHDHRVLKKQSWGVLWGVFDARRTEREKVTNLDTILQQYLYRRHMELLQRAFSHWAVATGHQQRATYVAHERITMKRYFARWRRITLENASKAQGVLLRKFFRKWRRHIDLRRMQEQQAEDFVSARDSRRLQALLSTWNYRTQHHRAALEEASAIFAANDRRRRLRSAMYSLNMALRNCEDADRAALELANMRILPTTFHALREHAENLKRLDKMAEDFRFYYLTTRTIKLLSAQTKQHKHDRMVDGYAQIRARIKIRQVTHCLGRLRSKHAVLQTMATEAELRIQTRLFRIGTHGFDVWRTQTLRVSELNVEASTYRNHKLLTSGMSALLNQHTDLAAKQQSADAFKQETDLAYASDAWKKLQWATFTTQRQSESADALKARNDTQHMKQMLRCWAAEAMSRKARRQEAVTVREEEPVEPESPSLRPASRVAARASQLPATPAYLQTPGRSRKTVRFRGLLPTPAPVTPFDVYGTGRR